MNEMSKTRVILTSDRKKISHETEIWLTAIHTKLRHDNKENAEHLMSKALQTCPNSGILWAADVEMAPYSVQKRKSMEAIKEKCDKDWELQSKLQLQFRVADIIRHEEFTHLQNLWNNNEEVPNYYADEVYVEEVLGVALNFCGGTHAGIEAVAGEAFSEHTNSRGCEIKRLCTILKVKAEEVINRVEKLLEELCTARKGSHVTGILRKLGTFGMKHAEMRRCLEKIKCTEMRSLLGVHDVSRSGFKFKGENVGVSLKKKQSQDKIGS